MLAEPVQEPGAAEFALFECDLPEDFEGSDSVREAPDELSELLDSAKDYPPALALARDEMDCEPGCAEAEFANQLAGRLAHHLQEQINSPFFMARARSTWSGYYSAGGYYWIVGIEDEMVLWVSRDYFVYQDPVEEFDLDPAEVERRFRLKI